MQCFSRARCDRTQHGRKLAVALAVHHQTIEYSTVREWSISQNCFNSKSLPMSMGRSVGVAPPRYITIENWSDSPYLNRFLSADTIVPGYANPQNLNQYSYVLNNPLRYTDPTGHMLVEGEGGSHVNYKRFPCAATNGLV